VVLPCLFQEACPDIKRLRIRGLSYILYSSEEGAGGGVRCGRILRTIDAIQTGFGEAPFNNSIATKEGLLFTT
jgi:hypothetical protein